MGYPDKRQKRVTKRHPQHECSVCGQMFEDIFDLTFHARTHNGPARSYSRARKAPKSPAVLHDTGHQTQVNREQTEDTFTLKRNGHSGKQVPDVSELTSTADSNSGHKNENLMQDIVTVKEDTEDRCFEKSVSPEAAQIGLYKDHVIKDELVLGSVLLQPRDVTFIVQNDNEKEPTSTVDSPTANDEETVSQDSVTVKVEPEERCFDVGMREAIGVDHLEYQIKDELVRDERCFEEYVSAEAVEIGLYKDHQMKDELVLGPVLLQPRDVAFIVQNNNEKEPASTVVSPTANGEEAVSQDSVTVKVESEERCFEESVSPEAAKIGVYKDHQIKDELVLWPELLQQFAETQDVAIVVNQNNEQELSTVDDPITNYKDTVTVKVDPEERCFNEGVTEAIAVDHLEHPLKCNHCDYVTTYEILLNQHLMTHTGDQPDKHGGNNHGRNGQLTIYSRTHSGVKPFQCSYCDYATDYNSHLQRHQMKHSSYKPFKCSYCDYATQYSHVLQRHQLKHTTYKPFKCSHCDYSSRYKADTALHELKHYNYTPIKCSHCDYATYHSRLLRRHAKKHMSDKPFKCSQCDYTTAYRNQLTRHKIKHTSDKPFTCRYCDYRSHYKSNVIKHELRRLRTCYTGSVRPKLVFTAETETETEISVQL